MNAADLPDETLFEGALKCRTPAERVAYFDQVCAGQPELRQRLEVLLEAHDQSGEFLEPAVTAARPMLPLGLAPEAASGTNIGRYKLLQKIGEGGMGVVYMAEQTEPVVRKVAFKIIKLGMDTRQVVARFEAERQALALMDHPNIAKVLDAGATDTGRPYFVMELVHGVPITEYCDKNKLSTQQRLELFIPVCQAIQHAHQKGIIHRDIKPSNVMVTLHDGVPVPKVIDFGVAKAINQRLTEKTLFTNYAQMIGTPAYMSPEQAEMSGLDIDTRSDIYSLGVLLYELLTGTTPFPAQELLSKGYAEMQRIIAQQEPPKPSVRISTMQHAERTVVATNRSMDAAAVNRNLQGELDWIVMKCLEKDRNRRYPTVNGLAADLRRHLNHEIVSAAAPTFAYQLQKLYARNRRQVRAAALAAVLLVAAATFSSWLALRARSAERHAVDQTRNAQAAEQRTLAASSRLASANTRLTDSVRELEMERAENLFETGNASTAIAHLAAILRRDPSNHLAGSRLISALVHRNLALPAVKGLRHPQAVLSTTVSPDGATVLTVAADYAVRLWHVTSGAPLGRAMQHDGPVATAQFTGDGKRVVTGSHDRSVKLWNALTGEPESKPLVHDGPITCLALGGQGTRLLSGTERHGAFIWDVPGGVRLAALGNPTATVTAVAFSPDESTVATGTSDGHLDLWKANTGTHTVSLKGHRDQLTTLQFSPDGSRLLSASHDGTARMWDATDGTQLFDPLPQPDWLHCALFSPNGERYVTAGQNGSAQVWKSNNGHPEGPPLLHEGAVRAAAFSPDGLQLATASLDLSVRLWNPVTGEAYCRPLRHGEWASSVSYTPAGDRLITSSIDTFARIWDVRPRRYQPRTVSSGDRLWAIEISPDGTTFATGSADGTARLWDIASGRPRTPALRHDSTVSTVAFSRDSRFLVTGDAQRARVWDAQTGLCLLTNLLPHAGLLRCVQFSPDGQSILTASADGTARLWSSTNGTPLGPPLIHGGEVWWADFSPDGTLVATASLDHTGRLWRVQDGQPVGAPLQHLDEVKHVAFSPDGTRLVTASTDNLVKIWDARSGQELTEPLQHARIVERACFSPDSRLIVTASLDRTARIWDAISGQALTPPLRHRDFVGDVRFSPDGTRVATACLDGSLRLWDVKSGRPVSERLTADPGTPLNHLRFAADGRRVVVAGNGSSRAMVWDIPDAPVPVPIWFVELTEEILGIRVNGQGNLEMLGETSTPDLAVRVNKLQPSGYYQTLARWLVADPGSRSDSPFADGIKPDPAGK